MTTIPALLAAGTVVETPQDDAAATFAPKIDKAMGRIDWAKSAALIAREVAAFHPWPLAYTHRLSSGRPERTMFHRARVVERDAPAAPGTVTRVERDVFDVACGEGAIEVREIQREGKRATDTGAYLRGNALAPGG